MRAVSQKMIKTEITAEIKENRSRRKEQSNNKQRSTDRYTRKKKRSEKKDVQIIGRGKQHSGETIRAVVSVTVERQRGVAERGVRVELGVQEGGS